MSSDNSTERAERCDKCRFFEKDDTRPNSGAGECHRYPPEYPFVVGFDWCGEFKPADIDCETTFSVLGHRLDSYKKLPHLRRYVTRLGLETVGDLAAMSEDNMIQRRATKSHIAAARAFLASLGLKLRGE